MFIEILGAEAGNLALKVLSTAGFTSVEVFRDMFLNTTSTIFSGALQNKDDSKKCSPKIPVHVIQNPEAA
jgi:glucokinase